MKTKMSIKKIALGIMAVVGIGLLAMSPVVSAFQGNPNDHGPNYNADLHDLKVDAFNSQDYAVWKDLMEQSGAQGRVLDVVNEDNFNTFVEAHNAVLSGDIELANELRSELGLNNGDGPHDGTGFKGQGMEVGQGHGRMGAGDGQMQQANFVDADGDGVCDNEGSSMGRGRGRR